MPLFWTLLSLTFGSSLWAQSPPPVKFLGVPAPVFTSGIEFPIGMAVDASGNVYIAEYDEKAVYKETLQGDGTYVRSTVASNFAYGPVGLAIDSAGNVYVGLDISSNVLKETLQGNGSYVQSQIGTGLGDVYGLAADSSGNVYVVTNFESETVRKYIPSGSTYTSSVIFTSPGGILAGLALDSSGNLFVAKEYGSTLYKLTPTGNPATTTAYTSSVITTGALSAFDVAVDSAGDLYVADTDGYVRLETPNGSGSYTETVLASGLSASFGVTISSTGTIYFANGAAVDDFSPAAVNLGTHAVKTASSAYTLNYTIQPETVVSAINVVSQGVINTQSGSPEFIAASGGTCTAQTYSDLTTCSVKVTFTPQFPGLRTGAVQFLDGSGSVLSTAYLYGAGTAPVAAFSSGTANLLSVSGLGTTPLNGSRGLVFDAAGNLFVADSLNQRIVKVAPGGAATVIDTPSITLSAPTGVALDGAGNLYIADSGNGRVVELSPQGVATVMDTNSLALSANYSVAVDGLSNVYTSDAGNNRVLVFPRIGTAYVLATTGVTLGSAHGVAADGNGNVFIADYSNSRVVKVNNGTGTVLGTGSLSPALLNPESVSVDAVGNVYVSDSGNDRMVEVSAGTTNGIVLSTGSYSLNLPDGAAVGNAGNLYICDGNNNRIVTSSQEAPGALTFTAPGATTPVTMLNLGNSALTLAVPGSGRQNPGFGTANFSLVNAGTTGYCPQLSSTSASASLAAGANCRLSLEFSPPAQSAGTLTDTLTVTDNTLAVAASTQSISLSGTSNPTPTVALTPSPASPIAYGQASTLSVAVTYTSGTPTGSVSFYDNNAALGSPVALTAGAASFAAQYYLPGTHSFQADYGGNANFNSADSTATSYVVNKASSTITPPSSTAPVAYGSSATIPVTISGRYSGAGIAAPTGQISYAISNSGSTVAGSGTAAISSGAASIPVANTLAAGVYTISLSYAGDSNYNGATAAIAALQVGGITTPVITWTQPAPLTFGAPLSGILHATAHSGSTTVAGTFTYTATAPGGRATAVTGTSVLTAGTYTLTATFTPANSTSYGTARIAITEVINQAASALKLASSMNPVLLLNPTILTATVSSPAGVPSGTISFLDGTAPIASASLANGVAAVTLTNLAVGSHSLSVVYSGNTNFSPSTSGALTQEVIDFTAKPVAGAGGSAGASQTVAPGGAATFALAIVPTSGLSLPTPTLFTLTGMPTGATATVSPSSWVQKSGTSWTFPANTQLVNIALTIQLPSATGRMDGGSPLRSDVPLLWCLLLFPFTGSLRRRLGRFRHTLSLLFFLAMGLFVLAGCSSGNGFFQQHSQTYTITGMVTSGALSHSTTITLTVE